MIRLLLDEDIHKSTAEQLRLRGYDAVHVVEIGRAGLSDEEQLTFASGEDRILISFNVRDYVKLHEAYHQQGKKHSGIILSKQVPIGEFIKKLAKILHNREEWDTTIHFL